MILSNEHTEHQSDHALDLAIIEELKKEGVPRSLFYRSSLLVLRGVFLSVIQYAGKRYVLAQQGNGELLAASGGMSFLESFNFPLLFSSLYIVSTKVSASKANPKKVGDLFRQGLVFGGLLMMPVLLLSLNAESIFKWMRQPDVVIDNAGCYFSVSSIAYFFDVAYRLLVRVAVGIDDFYLGLIGDGVESVVDLATTYVLINGKYGFSAEGVCGSAWGYATGAFAALISAVCYLGYTKRFEKYDLLNFESAIDLSELKEMISGGLHWACSSILADITQMLITFVCGLSGHGPLIARQVADSYYAVEAFLGDSFLEAGGILIAPVHALKEAKLFRDVAFWVCVPVISFSVFSGVILLFNLTQIVSIFEVNKNDFEIVKSFLRIQALLCIASSVMHSFNYLLGGCNETKRPFLLNMAFLFVCNSILVGLLYFVFNQGATAAFAVQLIGLGLSATGHGLLWKNELNKVNAWEQKSCSEPSVGVPVVVSDSVEMKVKMTQYGSFFSETSRKIDQGFNEFFTQKESVTSNLNVT